MHVSRGVNRQGESEERPDDSKVCRERRFHRSRSHLLSPARPSLLTTPGLKVTGPSQVGRQVLQRDTRGHPWKFKVRRTLEPSFNGILMMLNIFRERREAGSRGGNKRLHAGTQGKAVCGRFVNSRRDRGMEEWSYQQRSDEGLGSGQDKHTPPQKERAHTHTHTGTLLPHVYKHANT